MNVPVWNPAVEFMEREALERLQREDPVPKAVVDDVLKAVDMKIEDLNIEIDDSLLLK